MLLLLYEGIIESDDVAALSLEIEKSLNYCKKCNLLVESVKRKDTLVHLCESCKLTFLHILKQFVYCTWQCSVVVSALALFSVVNRHWARIVLGWVTVCGQVNHLGL